MTVITRQVELDMGHRVPDHGSKCRNPHGHRYKVIVAVQGEPIDERGNEADGMVIDFGVLAEHLNTYVHDPCDHGFMVANYDGAMIDAIRTVGGKLISVSFPPTAERLAEWWGTALLLALDRDGIALDSLTVWETPNSSATWRPS